MYRSCTTEKTAAQQSQIVSTLLQLMGRQHYDAISVTQLCAASGLSRKVFYRLFDNKDDVLCMLIDQALADYARTRDHYDSFAGDLPETARRFLLYWRENRQVLDVLYRSGKLSLLPQRVLTVALEYPAAVSDWIGLKNREDSTDALVFLVSGLMGLLTYWYAGGFSRPVEEVSGRMTKIWTDPAWSDFKPSQGPAAPVRKEGNGHNGI